MDEHLYTVAVTLAAAREWPRTLHMGIEGYTAAHRSVDDAFQALAAMRGLTVTELTDAVNAETERRHV
ncbi:hypothetical protein ACSMXN_09345 [Jatrophihabitans sp. DSM 45814]